MVVVFTMGEMLESVQTGRPERAVTVRGQYKEDN